MALSTIDTNQLATSSVTTAKLDSDAVTNAKLADSSVAIEQLDSTVTFDAISTEGSEFKTHNKTLFYSDFSLSGAISGTNIQNLATGTAAVSKTLPLDTYTTSTDGGDTVISVGSNRQGLRTSLTGDEFDIANNGMTMGVLFKKNQTDSTTDGGLIYYGDTGTDNHLFVRLQFGVNSSIHVGEDTGGSDVWTDTTHRIRQYQWGFFAVSIDTNGTLLSYLNGVLIGNRGGGTVTTPTGATFGIAGDPYNDNASNNTYASFFFYQGVATKKQLDKEYRYLQSVWNEAVF